MNPLGKHRKQLSCRKVFGAGVAQLFIEGNNLLVIRRSLEHLDTHVRIHALQHESLPAGDARDGVVLWNIAVARAERPRAIHIAHWGQEQFSVRGRSPFTLEGEAAELSLGSDKYQARDRSFVNSVPEQNVNDLRRVVPSQQATRLDQNPGIDKFDASVNIQKKINQRFLVFF
uniref:Uncharacterized protein n=1 Tax=Pseudomonas fluorescens (strain SBW25) TaxID=216595 RepID=A4V7F3_PSEFS|nr:hypothetical protein pQBR0458 [Pseudomonas fluorescens SBW25]